MPATILPFKAPRLAPEQARLLNALCVAEPVWRTPFGAGSAVWHLLGDAPHFPPACEITLRAGTDTWSAFVSDASFLLRHPAFSADGPSFTLADLPVEVRSAVIESLLVPVLDLLQAKLGTPTAFGAVRFDVPPVSEAKVELGFKVVLEGGPHLPDQSLFVTLRPHQDGASRVLADLLETLPANAPAPHGLASLPLELAFESGYLLLNQHDIASLEPDDILIPEVWHPSSGRLMLRFSRGHAAALCAPCSFTNGQAVLEAPLASEVEPAMDSNEQNAIDIRLSFELDRTVITLGELSSLAPGYVFHLNSDMAAPVTVRANGKAIARGRLVDMDGTLGVQLIETMP